MPSQLSGGQQQRVALARALSPIQTSCCWTARSPSIHFCAPHASKLRQLQKKLGLTFVHVTHSQVEAFGRFGGGHAGRADRTGRPPRGVFNAPANAVAQFIGGHNVFSATVRESEAGGMVIEVPVLSNLMRPRANNP